MKLAHDMTERTILTMPVAGAHRRIRAALAAVLAIVIGGVACDSGREPEPREATPANQRLRWEQAFPRLEVEAITTPDGDALPAAGRWNLIVLNPKACVVCDEQYGDWKVPAQIVQELGLHFACVAEREPARLASIASAEGIDYPLLSTSSSIFQITSVLNYPVMTLVDPDGRVRYVGRDAGTFEERVRVAQRQYHYLSAEPRVRVDAVRDAFPSAARIELASSIETGWLGESACRIGLSPWYAVAYGSDGSKLGYILPIDQETNCDVCDPLYLAVGVTITGQIAAIRAIEPIVSGGEVVHPEGFFRRFEGATRDYEIHTLLKFPASRQVDHATREVARTALGLAARSPELSGSGQ